ncbi:hypothetical protein CspeluHIS016_0601230 [Cutaneotrichosporon spelunceum]|uniref:Uncharacterized protein n=1 Tax=Cutaneotrichosporon spelunceum TaxID=1672016 RepID=A0AAD3TY55_9TREE|nr:hypothetical protein CspeluHIS016_0601230 [Cutaneotrichosporon spelunceum]
MSETSNSVAVVEHELPRKRSSKACEACRARRINCTVRLKARPKRAPSAKLFLRHQNQDVLESPRQFGDPLASASYAEPIFLDRRNPLDELEAALAGWCRDKGLPFSQLVFKVDTRLAGIPPTPLPPQPLLTEYEDVLMEQLLHEQGSNFDAREPPSDRTLLRSLYGRYRAMPNSLTDDQMALVYAALCTSRFAQIRVAISEGENLTLTDESREDITYYHKAYNALASWNRPSLVALWALFYLIPFSIGMGGPAETKDLLQQMAWQVKELGLHRRETASLYQPHDQVGALFSAFFYAEMFRSSLMDLRPAIRFSEIDVDPTPPVTMFPECLARSSFFTAKLLADYGDPHVDTGSLAYITAAEAAWMPYVREMRHVSYLEAGQRAKLAWAQFRYNWLRILLYLPHIGHERLAPQAWSTITRAVEQIMYSYSDLISVNQLNPSWPQVQRLVVCGQLLILAHDAGELHRREAQTLFQLLHDLLLKHQDTWPICAELIIGFQAVTREFDLEVGPEHSVPFLPVDGAVDPQVDGWPYAFGFDFDLSTFAFT